MQTSESPCRPFLSPARPIFAAALAFVILLAACSDGGDSGSDDSTTTTTGPVGEPTEVIARRDLSGCTPETPTGCVTVSDGAPAESRYTLLNTVAPDNTGTFLIDGVGKIVNTWPTNGLEGVALPEPGMLLAGRETPGPTTIARIIAFSTPCMVIMDWEGTTTWPAEAEAGAECGGGIDPIPFDEDDNGDPTANLHHDLQMWRTPVYAAPEVDNTDRDGRVLYLAHRMLTAEESEPVSGGEEISDDRLVELDEDGEEVLWEWSAAEHIDELGLSDGAREAVAEFSSAPGAIPVGGAAPPQPYGWLLSNSASYLGPNPHCEDPNSDACDQRFHPDNVIVGSRQGALMFIVARHDHPGGKWEAGDIVWTLGPDFSGTTFGPISGQHDVHMIPDGLPGAGNVLVFDNGSAAGFGTNDEGDPTSTLYNRGYSRVLEIDPTTMDLVWEYQQPESGADGTPRFSAFNLSSAQRLADGNTLIVEGNSGRVFEVTPDGEIAWEFVSPYEPLSIIDTPDQMFAVNIYRGYRVPAAWVPDSSDS